MAWARLSASFGNQTAVPDLDGDGVQEVLFGHPVQAFSGATGRPLWRSSNQAGHFIPLQLPEGDLDGDGVLDALTVQRGVSSDMFSFEPVAAVSGKTGRVLLDGRR